MPRLELASEAEQTGLSLTWSETTEDRFSPDVDQLSFAVNPGVAS